MKKKWEWAVMPLLLYFGLNTHLTARPFSSTVWPAQTVLTAWIGPMYSSLASVCIFSPLGYYFYHLENI
jgi:hypothetical protein